MVVVVVVVVMMIMMMMTMMMVVVVVVVVVVVMVMMVVVVMMVMVIMVMMIMVMIMMTCSDADDNAGDFVNHNDDTFDYDEVITHPVPLSPFFTACDPPNVCFNPQATAAAFSVAPSPSTSRGESCFPDDP